jgi:hypothetical protein
MEPKAETEKPVEPTPPAAEPAKPPVRRKRKVKNLEGMRIKYGEIIVDFS